MAKKYYAVRRGRTRGIYFTWEDCRRMTEDFSGAEYKSFSTVTAAAEYLEKESAESAEFPAAYAFVDGSYNAATNTYGYGGFLVCGGERITLQGSGSDPEMASMHNVAGEILGSQAAIARALELGLTELTIYYDYLGIEMWATGAWKRNKAGTAAYHAYVQSVRERIRLNFVKVRGHSGVEGNEKADRLAKQAAGIAGEAKERGLQG